MRELSVTKKEGERKLRSGKSEERFLTHLRVRLKLLHLTKSLEGYKLRVDEDEVVGSVLATLWVGGRDGVVNR